MLMAASSISHKQPPQDKNLYVPNLPHFMLHICSCHHPDVKSFVQSCADPNVGTSICYRFSASNSALVQPSR